MIVEIPLYSLCSMIIKIIVGILLLLVLLDFIRIRRLLYRVSRDPTMAAEIEIYELEADPVRAVLPG